MFKNNAEKKPPVIALGDQRGEVIVKINGRELHVGADGRIVPVPATYKLGELTQEGVYIGRFTEPSGEQRDYFADIDDARDATGKKLSLSFNEAVFQHARDSRSLGHDDWMLPTTLFKGNPQSTPDILGRLYKLRHLFNKRADDVREFEMGAGSWYWSTMSYNNGNFPLAVNFENGQMNPLSKDLKLSVRLVRSIAA